MEWNCNVNEAPHGVPLLVATIHVVRPVVLMAIILNGRWHTYAGSNGPIVYVGAWMLAPVPPHEGEVWPEPYRRLRLENRVDRFGMPLEIDPQEGAIRPTH